MIDLVSKATGRIIWQYQNGPKFRRWIRTFPRIATSQISEPCEKIANLINIDTAVGDQLDICARIAGISSRPRIAPADLAVFGYGGTPGAVGYNLAPYRGPDTATNIPAPDYLFRLVVKAKVLSNNSTGTVDDIKRAAEAILGTGVTVIDNQDMTMDVRYANTGVNPNVLYLVNLLDLIPRPQGVKITSIEPI